MERGTLSPQRGSSALVVAGGAAMASAEVVEADRQRLVHVGGVSGRGDGDVLGDATIALGHGTLRLR